MRIGNRPDERAHVADTVDCLPTHHFPFYLANRSLILLGENMLSPRGWIVIGLSHDYSLLVMIVLEVGLQPCWLHGNIYLSDKRKVLGDSLFSACLISCFGFCWLAWAVAAILWSWGEAQENGREAYPESGVIEPLNQSWNCLPLDFLLCEIINIFIA